MCLPQATGQLGLRARLGTDRSGTYLSRGLSRGPLPCPQEAPNPQLLLVGDTLPPRPVLLSGLSWTIQCLYCPTLWGSCSTPGTCVDPGPSGICFAWCLSQALGPLLNHSPLSPWVGHLGSVITDFVSSSQKYSLGKATLQPTVLVEFITCVLPCVPEHSFPAPVVFMSRSLLVLDVPVVEGRELSLTGWEKPGEAGTPAWSASGFCCPRRMRTWSGARPEA